MIMSYKNFKTRLHKRKTSCNAQLECVDKKKPKRNLSMTVFNNDKYH
ncbi:hypothetical protein SPPR111872_02120 [Sphingobacterium prati]